MIGCCKFLYGLCFNVNFPSFCMTYAMSLMIRSFLKRQIVKNRALILNEAEQMHDFMKLLMKRRNTGVKLTREEMRLIKSHVKHLFLYVPVLVIFILPFGSLLFPLLAEVLDRRQKSREK